MSSMSQIVFNNLRWEIHLRCARLDFPFHQNQSSVVFHRKNAGKAEYMELLSD